MADTVGMQDIRGININKAVTGFALASYVFKDRLCSVQSSSNWQERYYKETAADLTGGTGNAVEGVPRLAAFPNMDVSWTLVQSYHKKFGAETTISYEDILSNAIDTIVRSTLRIGRAVAKSVDAEVWDVVTDGRSTANINSVTIAAGSEWDSLTIANQNPIQNILNAKKEIAEDNYDPEGAYLCLNPKDYANLLGNSNVRNAGQFYSPDVTQRGQVGTICGLKILVSNNVTADYAAVVVAPDAATWLELAPLQTQMITNEGISKTIRSWEIGVCQLKNPLAVCLIVNTAV